MVSVLAVAAQSSLLSQAMFLELVKKGIFTDEERIGILGSCIDDSRLIQTGLDPDRQKEVRDDMVKFFQELLVRSSTQG